MFVCVCVILLLQFRTSSSLFFVCSVFYTLYEGELSWFGLFTFDLIYSYSSYRVETRICDKYIFSVSNIMILSRLPYIRAWRHVFAAQGDAGGDILKTSVCTAYCKIYTMLMVNKKKVFIFKPCISTPALGTALQLIWYLMYMLLHILWNAKIISWSLSFRRVALHFLSSEGCSCAGDALI